DEARLLGQLLYRIPAVEQDARLAVDVRDAALAACGGGVARVEREHPPLAVELRDVDDFRADCRLANRELEQLARIRVGETQELTCHPSAPGSGRSNYSSPWPGRTIG